ncbi:hypothetical protein C5C31_03575 [Rathayibacter rathayi]|uniref:Uncharacterized protein n=1 Tax=Rathayibacter rathayi TaxID=33887 RepID=A0ABX5ADK7_RATRA|nr:hypothetical protein [Rathayibacter rathayi]AZZ48887.1 hypothetical protein C1O28_06500 [Rathayibacter rathayi]MWV73981.1 hypothetical protein [Rathayibacter rathayi NCPPB 2980 = VKM Ac-1601]PPF24745.1 hypothetical protein C5C34_04310 [Rathayibacter rathayi]PPF49512.1 hypothetical protein C5C08_07060 [Rathayibacter rathayi]PPF80229.1 hypothetical protein C5C14_06900 [Rathayibacter rathayi]
MSLSTLHAIRTPPTLTQVNSRLWRVSSGSGAVVGHIELMDDPLGERYRARLLRAGMPAGAELGEFWNVDDAIEVFRVA